MAPAPWARPLLLDRALNALDCSAGETVADLGRSRLDFQGRKMLKDAPYVPVSFHQFSMFVPFDVLENE